MWDKIKEQWENLALTMYEWVVLALLIIILLNVWQMFQALIAPVANLVGTYIKGKQEKAKLKTQVELTKLQATKKQIEADGTWEDKAMSASDNSWKDEAWTLTFIGIIFASVHASSFHELSDADIALSSHVPSASICFFVA